MNARAELPMEVFGDRGVPNVGGEIRLLITAWVQKIESEELHVGGGWAEGNSAPGNATVTIVFSKVDEVLG